MSIISVSKECEQSLLGSACQEFALEENSSYLRANKTPRAEKPPQTVASGCKKVDKAPFSDYQRRPGFDVGALLAGDLNKRGRTHKSWYNRACVFHRRGWEVKKRISSFLQVCFPQKRYLVPPRLFCFAAPYKLCRCCSWLREQSCGSSPTPPSNPSDARSTFCFAPVRLPALCF